MKPEFCTTYDSLDWDDVVKNSWDTKNFCVPQPIPPDGDGWLLVGVSVSPQNLVLFASARYEGEGK